MVDIVFWETLYTMRNWCQNWKKKNGIITLVINEFTMSTITNIGINQLHTYKSLKILCHSKAHMVFTETLFATPYDCETLVLHLRLICTMRFSAAYDVMWHYQFCLCAFQQHSKSLRARKLLEAIQGRVFFLFLFFFPDCSFVVVLYIHVEWKFDKKNKSYYFKCETIKKYLILEGTTTTWNPQTLIMMSHSDH